MTRTNVDRGRWSTIAAVLISAAALLFAAPASADQADDAFIAALQRGGIVVGNRDNAIALGHSVCDKLGKGAIPSAVVATLEGSNFSAKEGAYVVGVSIAVYCPQFKGAVGNSGPPPGA